MLSLCVKIILRYITNSVFLCPKTLCIHLNHKLVVFVNDWQELRQFFHVYEALKNFASTIINPEEVSLPHITNARTFICNCRQGDQWQYYEQKA